MKKFYVYVYMVGAITWLVKMIDYGVTGELSELHKWLSMAICIVCFSYFSLKEFLKQ